MNTDNELLKNLNKLYTTEFGLNVIGECRDEWKRSQSRSMFACW
ncbi:hypothetical protein IMSAGC019_00301 [Lachnospiraceae bacterium]|nr:hypothetical protein IMSAGC019_00301 [Lachnospiraceae bacterium]